MGAEIPEAAGGLLPGLGPGSRVAGYRVEEQLGAGGMAVVFRAVDERLGRRVALKVMAPALAADAGFRERFIREARAAAAVEDPHIIPVHEAGEADGVLFIAMRYVPGGDVRSLVRQVGPLDPSRAAGIIAAVASDVVVTVLLGTSLAPLTGNGERARQGGQAEGGGRDIPRLKGIDGDDIPVKRAKAVAAAGHDRPLLAVRAAFRAQSHRESGSRRRPPPGSPASACCGCHRRPRDAPRPGRSRGAGRSAVHRRCRWW